MSGNETVLAGGATTCPLCGEPAAARLVRETLAYATPKGSVAVPIDVPHVVCAACGFEGFGPEGERARTAAIYRFHDRTPPWEIAALRERLGLSQRAFAAYLGVGHASVERWETGETMQSEGMDNLILLLSQEGIRQELERLRRERASGGEVSAGV